MIKPTTPKNEKQRIKSLNSYKILDTLPEKEYDDLTRIASQICNTPIALISLIDPERQWFKSHHGLGASETPRELAFCAHAINDPSQIFEVSDARKDIRFLDNPLSTDDPNVIFYAGAPLNTSDGFALGTICVIDNKPRKLNKEQRESLKALASQVISQFELRKNILKLNAKNKEAKKRNRQLSSFAQSLSHDIKTPIRGIHTIAEWLKEEYGSQLDKQANDWIDIIFLRTNYIDVLTTEMLNYSKATDATIVYEEFNLNDILNKIKDSIDINNNFTFHLTNVDQQIFHSKIAFITILQNLISNSIKHTDLNEGEIHISLTKDSDTIYIAYEDNGPGISIKYRKKVFKLFETIGEKTAESTGIGLTTIDAMIERLQGTIKLCDRENNLRGVRFEISIPKTHSVHQN